MVGRVVLVILLALFLIGALALTFNVREAESDWNGTVYIRADGSVDPPDAPIVTFDNVTYTLTDNITSSGDGIIVERDNIIIDGSGYTIQGLKVYPNKGIVLSKKNMTVTNTKIMTFFYAIYLNDSSYNEIRFNNLTNNMVGIHFESYSFYNSISGNNITNNELGIELAFSSKNRFFHNNIINNTQQVEIDPPNYVNYWDDGYPSGGNYWSDYTGEDLYGGPYQNETWSDCIGDTPYIINANNTDRYPLTKTKRAPAEIVLSKTIIGKGNSMPVNVTVVNKGDSTETFNVILYANTTAVNRTEVTLTSGSYAIITLTWNTSSFAKGNYTIRAYVWPALGETSIEDTTATYSVITVTIPGDGDCDGDIDIYDVVLITSIYGLKMGDANYNPNVDWLDDGIINIYDVVTATSRYGQKDP